jgi:hypothetical protein
MRDRLLQLWQQEISGSQICVVLGREFPEYTKPLTRNAVIGTINRLRIEGVPGFKELGKRTTSPVIEGERIQKKRVRHRGQSKGLRADSATQRELANPTKVYIKQSKYGGYDSGAGKPPQEFNTTAFDTPTDSKPKTMLELGANECRWPIDNGAGATLFCGQKATHKSYCAAHAQLQYRGAANPYRRAS